MPGGSAGAARGRAAEAAVLDYLVSLGMSIVATNLRVGHYEMDVVARDQDVVVVVEVRTRGATAWTSGFGSLDAKKRARIRRAGERLWQRRYKRDASVRSMRFDAASVTFGPEGPTIEYVRGAF